MSVMQSYNFRCKFFIFSIVLIFVVYLVWEPYFDYFENIDIKTLFDVCNKSYDFAEKSSRLRCYLKRIRDPLEIFHEKIKVEVLSWQPFMAIYHDVFTEQDIRIQKSEINQLNFDRAMTIGKYGFNYHSKARTGGAAWLHPDSEEIDKMWYKINRATGLQVELYWTGFKVLKYNKGEFYRLHHDSHAFQRLQQKPFSRFFETLLHPFMRIYNNCDLGKIPRPSWKYVFNCVRSCSFGKLSADSLPLRLGTIILPVNQWQNGGETIFPEMNIKLKLAPGSFVFFMTLFPNGTMDERHLHGACPLISEDVKILMQGRVQLSGHVIQAENYIF